MPNSEFEILSIVDTRDCVIGQDRRSEIHRRGLRHRAVHVLIYNRAGQVFLQQRADTKDRNPGLWDSAAAGHVDAHETYVNCAVREVMEELGIDTGDRLQKLFKLPPKPETGMEFCMVYRLGHEGPFRLDPDEIQRGKWFTPLELDRWLEQGGSGLTQTFQSIWLQVRKLNRALKKTGAVGTAPE